MKLLKNSGGVIFAWGDTITQLANHALVVLNGAQKIVSNSFNGGAPWTIEDGVAPADTPYVKPLSLFTDITPTQFLGICVKALAPLNAGDGFGRMDQLLGKSKTIEKLLDQASTISRTKGNLPAALTKLMTGANSLTQGELDAIDDEWRKL